MRKKAWGNETFSERQLLRIGIGGVILCAIALIAVAGIAVLWLLSQFPTVILWVILGLTLAWVLGWLWD